MTLDDELAAEREVLGDELQQRGHPLGELIALQLALERLPADAPSVRRNALARRVAGHLDRHHDVLFGALAPYVDRLSKPDLLRPAMVVEAWRGGFADAIKVRDVPGLDTLRVLRDLPIARFARRLDVEVEDAASLDELAHAPMLALRELYVHATAIAPALSPPLDLSSITPPLVALEMLSITTKAEVAPIVSPTVRTLRLFHPGQGTIHRADLPALEDLSLADMRVDLALLDRHPRLQQLVLHSCRLERGWVERLIHSPQLANMQLMRLGTQLVEGAELALLLDHADRLAMVDVELNARPLFPFSNEQLEACRHRLPATIRVVP